MAERSTPGTDDRRLPDCQNFEHGVVSSDAVYVPHSKQSFGGRCGRGKSSGNYRRGQGPQQNDNWNTSESDDSKLSGTRGKYSGGRGQKPGQRSQYYGRRNVRSAAYESRQLPESGEALFVDNSCFESNVGGHSASFGVSADTYNGVSHSHFDETKFNAPSVHVRERVRNSRYPRKARGDHRYEEWSQRRGGDQQPSRRGHHGYSRGRGYRGASNYFTDEKFAIVNFQDTYLYSNSSNEAVAGYEAPSETDFCDTAEFTSSERKYFGSEGESSRELKSNGGKLTQSDDRYAVHRRAAVSHDSNSISDDLQQFHNLCISNVPKEVDSPVVFSAKIKSNDPEFESQRGSCSWLVSKYNN